MHYLILGSTFGVMAGGGKPSIVLTRAPSPPVDQFVSWRRRWSGTIYIVGRGAEGRTPTSCTAYGVYGLDSPGRLEMRGTPSNKRHE